MAEAPQLSAAEEARKEKLKKAGDAYFQRILAEEANAGLTVRQEVSTGPGLPLASFDEDFLQVEAVVEGSRTYVLGTLLVISNAVSLVFIKASLDALLTPTLMAFIHLLPTAATLWLLAAQGALTLRPFSPRSLQGAAPTTVLATVRVLALFAAAPRCSLWLLLCWTVVVPLVVRAAQEVHLKQAQPGPGPLAGLALGLLATVSALLVGPWPGLGGLLALLTWTAAELAAVAWDQLRQRPELVAGVLGEASAVPLRAAAEAEASLDQPTLVFMQQALPALPLLVLGFVVGEGKELINHELSVPAVTMILLSVVAWAVAPVCDLLAADSVTRQARTALLAAAPLGTVVTEAAVRGVAAGQVFGLAAAVVAAVAGLGVRLAVVAKP